MKLRSYQELIVWQKAMDLVQLIYARTMSFPREEIYGLTSPLRTAAVSISFKHSGRARQADDRRFRSAFIDLLRFAA